MGVIMKILIVDDMEVNLELLEARLQGSGYEVASAKNGIEALETLKRESIDMIISDILMPKMDGFQLCRECKKDDTLRKIPFIFYTATYTDKKDEEFALSLGAEKFIVKPAESKHFMEIIKGIFKNYKKGIFAPSEIPVEEEEIYLKEYNERLINKLEKKMLDLESEITERKQAEEKIKEYSKNLERMVEERTREINRALYDTEEARDRIDGILKSIGDGLIVTDLYNRIILMNRAAEDMLGVHLTEVINRPIDFAIHDKIPREQIKATLDKKKEGYEFDFKLQGKDAERARIMRARTSIIEDKAGKKTGIITIFHDITCEGEVG
jgi:PAS domain S-box-containing protein